VVTSCSSVSCSSSVRFLVSHGVPCTCLPLRTVSITVFAGLASEFFWRRIKRTPFPGRAAVLKPSGPSDVEMKGQHARSDSRATLLFVHDGEAAGLTLYMRLALFGLVTSTVLLYIRYALVLGFRSSGTLIGAVTADRSTAQPS
jgi:hypothetical protein